VKPDEARLEAEIVDWLTADGGYDGWKLGAQSDDFDPGTGIDTAELFAFLGLTQADEWERLKQQGYGGEANEAQRRFVQRLARQVDDRGLVDVLRHGVVDHGVTIWLAYFRPAHGLTESLLERYRANRVTVTRQLQYDPASAKAVDLGLFVNGLLVATAELKNAFTHQGVEQAKAQYRTDRDPKNPALRRAVVHFAVDTELVEMTTRLAGPSTRFLPFNRGHAGGKGNPANPTGHRSAYLWERIWQRDAWLDLLARFIHVEKPAKSSRADPVTIFPRWHQWDAVLAMESAARSEGAGHSYLVQHSAGSGKSNTIAWLAHRLSNLHDSEDTKVFDKVVVITDRRVLDRQLQDTVHQFEQTHGVVRKIDESSAQLAEALAGAQARIIITTLQKFPIVLQRGIDLPDRRYAVVVDEAHSSQTGEAAKDLKLVLSGSASPEEELTAAEVEDRGLFAEAVDPVEEALARGAGARVRQPNLSFFAFTATPKGRTLELFGRANPATGKHEPFHLYSMRQAIEEGFILDVLAQYVTYETYWNIEKAAVDDPAYETRKARAAIARFVSLHEHNLAQKAEVIVEHFRAHVAWRLKGRAKAMVVTSSRLHAVRYKEALDKYCREHGYRLGVLVAFSGTVFDEGEPRTEANMNHFPDTQTAAEFNTDAWSVLVVAEKYQTGFDQPLLTAMYVDKTLTGLAAVQTLSRLNRIHEDKRQEDVFVLDFRNDADDIAEAFEPWYGQTVAPPTDPNMLYDTRRELDGFGVLWPDEVERAVALLVGSGATGDHGRLGAALAPSVDRFYGLDEDDQNVFRDALNRFVRIYSFLSQIVAFYDTKLERDYLFCRALAALVRADGGGTLDLGEAVELTHLRVEQTFAGSVALEPADGEVSTIYSTGGRQVEPDLEPLSQIIATLNERYGTSWQPADRVFYDVVAEKLAARPDIQQQAAANTADNFALVMQKEFLAGVVGQLAVAEDMAFGFIDKPDLQADVLAVYAPLIQARAKVARREYCPIGELLGPDLESKHLEYKATLRTNDTTGELMKVLETSVLKTIAAFLNGAEGGTLLIGVADDGSVHGLDSDYATLRKEGRGDRDVFQLHLANIIGASMGDAAGTAISAQFHSVDGRDLCRVHVRPSAVPVEAKVSVEKNGQTEKKTAFYVRRLNGTRELSDSERQNYVVGRWPQAWGQRDESR
jgi:type I restriction enzyme R subunit